MRYQCTICGKVFGSRRKIIEHLEREHGVSEISMDYYISVFEAPNPRR